MNVIETRNLRFSYGGRYVLRGIDLEIGGGLTAILGPNGAGKSTLVKCMAGILDCDGAFLRGRRVREYPRRELAGILAYVPQRAEAGFMTVFDTVLLGRRPYMGLTPSKADLTAVENAIDMLGLSGLALKRTNEISGGELQKVNIARALAQDPAVLIMDEPTNNLDMKSQLQVMDIAGRFAEKGGTSIVVMHDVNMALRFASRFIFMKDGRVVADGGREILNPGIFQEVYDVSVELHYVNDIPVVIPL